MVGRTYYDPIARQRASERRQARMADARSKGTHSKIEWKILHDIFGRCVVCGIPYDNLYGGSATRDHIQPVICEGCDCIGNLQPVCRQCNSRAPMADYREYALPGWQTIYLHRLGAYF